MAKNSHIEWTNHTFNPWWGCHKVSPACDNCYAEIWARRVGQPVWGLKAPRRFFGDAHWIQPLRWDHEAAAAKSRARVFCASMADVFEQQGSLDAERSRLWHLIDQTPNLDWLLLTKRPQNILSMTPWVDDWPRNVWIGTTVENQKLAEQRLPYLLAIPAAVRFLSCEPLLGPLDLSSWFRRPSFNPIDWIIAGGESGAHSRPMHPDWISELLRQCQHAQIPFHFKQWGQWAPAAAIAQGGVTVLVGQQHPVPMKAVGKKTAGRVLDGRTWDGVPRPSAQTSNLELHKLQGAVHHTMVKGKDRQHFQTYREQTRVKHSILAAYLPAYYHILKRSSNNLVYIDGFAGPGAYVDLGNTYDGSPLLALKLIASRSDFSEQVSTVFIESDELLYAQLKDSVDTFFQEHPHIRMPIHRHGTFSDVLSEIIGRVGGNLAPTFLFVDPCGLSGTSFATIRTVMDNNKCESFIFFNIDGVRRIAGLKELSDVLVELIGSEQRAEVLHKELRVINSAEERERLILSEYCKALREDMEVRYIIPFRVEHEDQRRTSHYLIHASKHPLAFRIMKDVMWRRGHAEDQLGGLELRQSGRTDFVPMFDRHADMKEEMLEALSVGPLRVSVFYEEWTARPTNLECESSYKEALLELERNGNIEVLGKDGRNIVPVNARRVIKNKPTLAKDYYVRFKKRS
jgi:three-Cys-motif partner protein